MSIVTVKIFTRPQIESTLETSQKHGLWVTGEVVLNACETTGIKALELSVADLPLVLDEMPRDCRVGRRVAVG